MIVFSKFFFTRTKSSPDPLFLASSKHNQSLTLLQEHHLQAAISASQAAAVGGNVAQIYIPTPDTAQSSIPHEQLYQLKFSQPATYIRFSSTVEDCCGCQYNMTEEDDAFLKELNEKLAQRRDASTQCSEDVFEEAMNFFEETSKSQQPYSSVGEAPPVLPWDDMQNAFDENIDEPARTFAKDIYEHWSSIRAKNGNAVIHPSLRIKLLETTNDADDNDPYVCFRRREVRQVRKTRGRDAQSVEKLRKLRKELEEARALVGLIRQREVTKRDQLAIDRQLFEQRRSLRQLKRNLPEQYKDGDEELLLNQKVSSMISHHSLKRESSDDTDLTQPQKKKPLEIMSAQRAPPAQLRLQTRLDGRGSETDLVTLAEVLERKGQEIDREIKMKMNQHTRWNENYNDSTREPLTPPLEAENFNFRPAMTEYLPTPPASIASEHSGDAAIADASSPHRKQDSTVAVKYTVPSYDVPARNQPAFRRRVGRGGRMMIDRRGMRLESKEDLDPVLVERFKFDQDEDDEDDASTYLTDPYDINNMRYRAAISGSFPHGQPQPVRRAQVEASASSQAQPNPPKNAPD